MSLKSAESVGPVFESQLGLKNELTKQEKARVSETTRHLLLDYQQAYAEFSTNDWQATSERLTEKSQLNSQQIEAHFASKEAQLLDALNKTFGELPDNYIQAQLKLKHYDHISRDEANMLMTESAGWQANAIRTIYELGKVRLDQAGEQRVLDVFFKTVDLAYGSNRMVDKKTMEGFQYSMLSGLFGPVALVDKLAREGYTTWLPQPDDDVRARCDLIYGKQNGQVLPTHLWLTQSKSMRSSDDSLRITDHPNFDQLSPKDALDWKVMSDFAADLNRAPHFADIGVDFSPVWANISHAGLRDADDWRSGLDSINASDVAIPLEGGVGKEDVYA